MVCPVCDKTFLKRRVNQKYCSKKCQTLGNQRNWNKNNKEHIKKYREKTRESRNNTRRKRYNDSKAYRENRILVDKKYHKNNPNAKKAGRLRKYGLTYEQFEQMLKDHFYQCAICGFEYDGNKAMFPFIDHNHKTGKVRGLLCSKCNFAIGQLNDDTRLLKRAIKYLEKNDG